MKRLMFTFILGIFLSIGASAEARDAQRKISSGKQSSSVQLTTVPTVLYDIEIVATAAGGYAVVFDSATDASGTELVEIREAVQNDSAQRNLGLNGIKAENGLYLYLNNATAIVYYHEL